MNIKNLIGIAVATGSLLLAASFPTHADIVTPGQLCQPANIGQAINLQQGWSQFGMSNNSPIGGSAFFVVCPILSDNDSPGLNGNFIDLETSYRDPAALDVTCSILEVDMGNSGTNQQVESATTLNSANPGSGTYPQGQRNSVAIPASFSYSSDGDEILVAVCVLPPQTRIGHFALQ